MEERLMFSSNTKTFNTKNILFICAGAFSGIVEYLNGNIPNRQMGFCKNNLIVQPEPRHKITSADIIEYGLMPEIVGRLPVIVHLKSLEESDLVRILTEPKNSLVKQYEKLFDLDGVTLEFTPDALNAIARTALTNETGARGLRTIVEEVLTKVMYDMSQNDEIWKCVITQDCILGKATPIMLMQGELKAVNA
jgi:ATP-dependent Clp protease ATP-binding subunit ClpX